MIQALCPAVFSSEIPEDMPERVVRCMGRAPDREIQCFTHIFIAFRIRSKRDGRTLTRTDQV